MKEEKLNGIKRQKHDIIYTRRVEVNELLKERIKINI